MKNDKQIRKVSLFDIQIQIELLIADFYKFAADIFLNKLLESYNDKDESHYYKIPDLLNDLFNSKEKCKFMVREYLYNKYYIEEISEPLGTRPEEKKKTIKNIKKSKKKIKKLIVQIKQRVDPSIFAEIKNYVAGLDNLISLFFYIIRYRRKSIKRINLLRQKICFSDNLS